MLNIVKTMTMSLIIFIGSSIVTKENFRAYFLFMLCANLANQLILLFNFRFKVPSKNSVEESEL